MEARLFHIRTVSEALRVLSCRRSGMKSLSGTPDGSSGRVRDLQASSAKFVHEALGREQPRAFREVGA